MNEFFRKEKEKDEKNRIKNKPIVLVTYVMVFLFMCLFGYIIYFMVKDADTVIANSSNKRQNAFADEVVRGDIVTSDGAVVATTKVDSDGNEVRSYPYGDMFAHAVGYNDYGKSGLELSMNFYLLRSHVNIFQRVKNELKEEKNMGDTVVTTLNYDLQKAAYDALGNNKGAVVVLEPDTGKILAMVSKPSFDPNDIDTVWEEVHSEEGENSTVLLNRATQGLYAPGSTFKVVTLLAYIRQNSDYENYTYDCQGVGTFQNVTIHCASEAVHGTETIADSLAYSCNTSFSNLGITLDLGQYRELADSLLFNSELPYDGTYSSSKFVLDSDSDPVEVPQTVIGQGQTQITPLHNALIMAAIANGGIMMKPYLVDSIENADGATIQKFKSKSYKSVMEPEETEILTEMLQGVSEYGTAARYFSGASYTVAGKTGTAEYDNEGNCNSWYVGFSNVENPDIVVSVIVEDYSTNQLSGAKVAKQIFDTYYQSVK
jgi:peptidoglycan glycosyltransferase